MNHNVGAFAGSQHGRRNEILSSVQIAVLGATAVCAALADRQRTGSGRAIVIPRLAAGLSAIGVLAMGLEGVEPHLMPPSLLSFTPELAAEASKARESEAHMVRLANRRCRPRRACARDRRHDGRVRCG
jgi:crotonobetainyl-CoA:carnitine CoA-transferase CaiB-like acyl-CoA transferase